MRRPWSPDGIAVSRRLCQTNRDLSHPPPRPLDPRPTPPSPPFGPPLPALRLVRQGRRTATRRPGTTGSTQNEKKMKNGSVSAAQKGKRGDWGGVSRESARATLHALLAQPPPSLLPLPPPFPPPLCRPSRRAAARTRTCTPPGARTGPPGRRPGPPGAPGTRGRDEGAGPTAPCSGLRGWRAPGAFLSLCFFFGGFNRLLVA